MEPIRVYVGCAANHEDLESQAVVEWSLRKHATQPVEITWMRLSSDPDSPFYSNPEKREGWRTELWATPFSGFRWAVPWLAGTGKAIYCDSDFIFFGDIAELHQQTPKPPAVVLGRGDTWRLCCSLWDCEAAQKAIPPLARLQAEPTAHRTLTMRFGPNSKYIGAFQGDWNNLDGRDGVALSDSRLKALHYTDMRTQPQLKHAIPRLKAQGRRHWFDGATRAHPRADVQEEFDRLLQEAATNGYGVEHYLAMPAFGQRVQKRSFAHQ